MQCNAPCDRFYGISFRLPGREIDSLVGDESNSIVTVKVAIHFIPFHIWNVLRLGQQQHSGRIECVVPYPEKKGETK
jgi:hypothetical protein